MAQVILIDGPEKAGKTTLATMLAERHGYKYRHLTQPSGYSDYLKLLLEDLQKPDPVVWDRGWPSDTVYGSLMPADTRRFPADPWLGEWMLGRHLQAFGLRVILGGPEALQLARRRETIADITDHDLHPAAEQAAYLQYGKTWDYTVLQEANISVAAQLSRMAADKTVFNLWPNYVGQFRAPVIFVEEPRTRANQFTPFQPVNFYAESLGPLALKCGWANTNISPELVSQTRLVVACGTMATAWCHRNRIPATVLPHPQWLSAWKAGQEHKDEAAAYLLSAVQAVLKD